MAFLLQRTKFPTQNTRDIFESSKFPQLIVRNGTRSISVEFHFTLYHVKIL